MERMTVMYNPYENNHNNNLYDGQQNQSTDGQEVQSNYNATTNTSWENPAGQQNSYSSQDPSHTSWNGSYYHSAYHPGGAPQNGWDPNPKKEKKPMSKGKKIALKVVAGVLACCVISTGTLAGFTALVNQGVISINTTTNTEPLFVINKLDDSSSSTTTTQVVSGDDLTPQEVAAKILPSVVCIQNYQISRQYNWGQGMETSDSDVSPAGEGSGIIATADGYIITNAHVVDGATSLKVVTYDGDTYEAELVGSDSITDLAVLKIDATGLTPAEFGSSSDLQVADEVMAVGNPGGMEFSSSVTMGYVSALNRVLIDESGMTMTYIQTDAAINPGNSGGALVNMKGQVVGINSAKIVADGYEGLGFAIPIDDAQPIISDLTAYGYVRDRAALGISGQYIDSITARFNGLPTGMYVAQITSSNVSDAGIQEGDVIMQIDGKDVTSTESITAVVTSKKPGDTVTLQVGRPSTGEILTMDVTLTQVTGN